MLSIQAINNDKHLEKFAIAAAVMLDDDPINPIIPRNSLTQTYRTNDHARASLAEKDLLTRIAFDITLRVIKNLKTRIHYIGGWCRILTLKDIELIGNHAMNNLITVLKPYHERLKLVENDVALNELVLRIGGVFHRDEVVVLATGAGLHYTGLTKLYYDKTRYNIMLSVQRWLGYVEKEGNALFYCTNFPTIEAISAVVSNILDANLPKIKEIKSDLT